MTQPGFVAPTTPGWWVRTNRVGTNKTGVNIATTAVGYRDPRGTAAGSYGWAGTAVGVGHALNLQFIGANADTISVTIPSHQVGDLLVMFAYNAAANTVPSAPTPGGDIPAFAGIPGTSGGANGNACYTASFVATTNHHTSGSWTDTSNLIAVVLRSQAAVPIGGAAQSGANSTSGAVAPAVTMTHTDGSSLLLHFFGRQDGDWAAWSAAPAGYTRRATIDAGSCGACLDTKNSTTSDGAVTHATDGSSSVGYRGATVEVLAY